MQMTGDTIDEDAFIYRSLPRSPIKPLKKEDKGHK